MLRKLLPLGLVSVGLAITSPAFAADVLNAPAPVSPQPEIVSIAHDWSGLYVGAHAGYVFGDTHLGFPPPGTAGTTGPGFGFSTDGFAGGGQAGYNWQIDKFVVGGEADVSWANLEGSRAIPGGTVDMQADWLSTIRGRAGAAFDRVFLYGTAGVAFTSMETSVSGSGVTAASDKNTLTGWTAGAGVEVALTENLSMKGEYLWLDFNDEGYGLGGPRAVPGDFDGSYVRAGLNYKLDLF
jgi:outer membrane immunogenic protein